jgi:hypothetical protein
MQVDPTGMKGGINLYAYVGTDPLKHTDATGMAPDQVEGEDAESEFVPAAGSGGSSGSLPPIIPGVAGGAGGSGGGNGDGGGNGSGSPQFPLGFQSAEQFSQACSELCSIFSNAGIAVARPLAFGTFDSTFIEYGA